MFVVAPLLLVALLVWIDRGAPAARLCSLWSPLLVAAVLPALIPFERFLQLKVRSDTLMMVPLWNVQDSVDAAAARRRRARRGARGRARSSCSSRARYALVLPAAVLGYFALAIQPIHAGPHGMERAAADALFEGIRVPDRDWIDRAVPDGAEVAVALDRAHAPLHGQPERVLQPLGRAGLHARRADARRLSGDGRHGRREHRRGARRRRGDPGRVRATRTARSRSTASRSPATSGSG